MRVFSEISKLSDQQLLDIYHAKLTRAEDHQKEVIKSLGLSDYRNYKPYPLQEECHISEAQTRCFLGGNYTGKTFLLGMEARWFLTGTNPYHPWKNKPYPIHGMILGNDSKQMALQGGIQSKVISMLNPDEIKTISWLRKSDGIIRKIVMNNGNTVTFMSSEAKQTSFMGSRFHWVIIDEDAVPNSNYWNEITSRVPEDDSIQYRLFGMTPNLKSGYSWSSEYLFPLANKLDSNIRMWEASMYDNPYMTDEQRDNVIKNFMGDERELNARIYGNWRTRRGLIYEFKKDVHEIGELSFEEKKKSKAIYVVIDPHPSKPIAVSFICIAVTGHIIAFDELYEQGLVKDVAERIKSKLKGLEHLVKDYIIDYSSKGGNKIEGRSIFDEFRDCGISCVNCVKDVAGGIEVTKRYLFNAENANTDEAGFFVTSNCINTIREFRNYCWDKDTGKPNKHHDEMMDCIRYFFCDEGAKQYIGIRTEARPVLRGDIHYRDVSSKNARIQRRLKMLGAGCGRNR